MSRYGTLLLHPISDRTNYDGRALYPINIAKRMEPNTDTFQPYEFFDLPKLDAGSFYWKLKTFKWSYSINSSFFGTQSGSGSGVYHVTDIHGALITDERGLPLGDADGYGFSDVAPLNLSTGAGAWGKDGDKNVFFTVGVVSSSNLTNIDAPGTTAPSAVTCTIMGVNIPMFSFIGATNSGFITVEPDEYWPYDNDKTASTTDGPIWRAGDDKQLITPVPPLPY